MDMNLPASSPPEQKAEIDTIVLRKLLFEVILMAQSVYGGKHFRKAAIMAIVGSFALAPILHEQFVPVTASASDELVRATSLGFESAICDRDDLLSSARCHTSFVCN